MRPPCGAYSCDRIHSHGRCYWTLPSQAVLTQGYRHHCSHGTRCHQPLCPELLLEWDHSLAPGRLAWLPYPRPPMPHPWGLGPNNTSHLARVLLQPDSVSFVPTAIPLRRGAPSSTAAVEEGGLGVRAGGPSAGLFPIPALFRAGGRGSERGGAGLKVSQGHQDRTEVGTGQWRSLGPPPTHTPALQKAPVLL